MRPTWKRKFLPLAAAIAVIGALITGGAGMANAATKPKLRHLYTYDFSVGYQAPGIPSNKLVPVKASVQRAFTELRSCFNCSFPVSGAPKSYPKKGQLIKLTACGAGVVCKPAPVKFYPVGKDSFKFIAQKGHFDGAWSKVTFTFWKDKKGYLHLRVVGYVTDPSIADALNKQGAHDKWFDFARRLGTNIWVHCGNPCKS